ncbi:MAG TPA: 3-carboxy-cis,cis-muconate cycloisomerase [Casimicrobiaceae bacterium]
MPATAIDSSLFGNAFSSEPMRKVFSDENRIRKYLEFEAALATVQGRLGVIPADAAAEISANCVLDKIDMNNLRADTERIGSPVLGLVQQLSTRSKDGLGEYCHWGATTQDVTDTATILQVRQALDLVASDLAAISGSLADLARRHRDTPMVGRSYLQHAVPITFGFKIAALLSAIERHRQRLAELSPRVLVGEFAGAVGTLASLPAGGLDIQAALMKVLRLGQPDIAWHTQRDRIAEVGCVLGLVTGTLAKLATDVKLMMQTEIGETFEPAAPGRGSSSTMPQKRNPVSCVYIHVCASVVRQHVAALLEAMVSDHERASGSWQIEWVSLPDAFLLTSGALTHARSLAAGLEVDEARMRANLDLTHGLIVSEAVMMGLAPHLGRGHAHDLVQTLCAQAIEQRRPLFDMLAETPEITRHVDADALRNLSDPARYLGLSAAMVDRVLATLR